MISINQLINIIEESVEEMSGYHGSGSDFDKFNHKKFLGKGCGSQSFGWGTYITDDKAIGDSYSEIFKRNSLDNGDIILGNGMRFNVDNIQRIMDIKLDKPYRNRQFGDNSDLYSCSDGESEFLYNLFSENHSINGIDIDNINKKVESYINNILNEFDSFKNGNEFQRNIYNKLFDRFDKMRYLVKELNNICHVQNIKPTLYEVDIPDDNGNNYLDWYNNVNKDTINNIISGFHNLPKKYYNMAMDNDSYGYIDSLKKSDKLSGKSLYQGLSELLGSDKAASLYLLNCCGIIGIKYESGTLMRKPDGAQEDGHNYVLFNANDVKITNKESL